MEIGVVSAFKEKHPLKTAAVRLGGHAGELLPKGVGAFVEGDASGQALLDGVPDSGERGEGLACLIHRTNIQDPRAWRRDEWTLIELSRLPCLEGFLTSNMSTLPVHW